MTTIRRFTCDDLFSFNNVNLDYFTETFDLPFYLEYLAKWPEYCLVAEGPGGQVMGYILGKVEGRGLARRQGLARRLMDLLEEVTIKVHDGYFVDLFVRASNASAISMYNKFGYTVYRRVLGYYSGEEDALDMRKAMPRDVAKRSVVPLKRPVRPEDLECD